MTLSIPRALRSRLLEAAVATLVCAAPAAASQYDFVPAPQIDLNRIYRIDRVTGEVGACQYGLKDGTIGVTFCFPVGEGAGKQEPGEYGLVPSKHAREAGVFRVNYRTGEMSVCYVLNGEVVVCTPQAGTPAAAAATQAPDAGTQSPAGGASAKKP
ncbi:hypothetical protein QNA08_16535 [Chelatococcus sp. SYSU_G07232]|uniref:Uncharacterized protein n=1 Tax=Chelatococcus albus TaxID=3047466 RepID=A0ABT7AKC7_9HYPH|nr:hypothetical protein [Chelatococcus sp. SYSU_G07232]MDJ1159828.1 hypothetical protein [Chelatococcus sp. SYSU_G07232]